MNRKDAGFTLLETIATLALVALAISVVLPRMSGSRQAMKLRAAAVELSSSLKDTRTAALSANADRVLVVDTARRNYGAFGVTKTKQIPRDIALRFEAKASEAESPSRAGFRFRPDGTASGGTITLQAGRDIATISVDWLTGSVSLTAR